ncbi:MAG: MogA/MoaB family molybdenum cofactor biosynthesis protein [Methanobacteriota archaeon]
MGVREHHAHAPRRVGVAILTVSDTRTLRTDASGRTLAALVARAGHAVVARGIVKDDVAAIRRAARKLLVAPGTDALIVTGGTGIAPRDVTPEAFRPLIAKPLPGFGELFRMLSYRDVGPSAIASRADAGIASGRPVFLLPGSEAAVRLAATRLILPELGHLVAIARQRPVILRRGARSR